MDNTHIHTIERKKGGKTEIICQGSHYGCTSFSFSFFLVIHFWCCFTDMIWIFPGPIIQNKTTADIHCFWFPFRCWYFWISKDTYATETAVVWLPPAVTCLDPDKSSSTTNFCLLAGPIKWSKRFIGMGKMMVELCSAAILLKVWRYRSCNYKVVGIQYQSQRRSRFGWRESRPASLIEKRPKIYESTTAYTTKKAARCDLPARPRSSRQ